ncbi:hypothetical protein [Kineococcus glutinatus]|uniref:Polysaccharide chain length determinant N-terminal domain-containing protein n=1 Tax=Kineococcus glutinatus TaxID=1070872 RepID=A0ABP9HQV7_9ACTN
MNAPDPTTAPASPLTALARRWWWGVGLGLLGLAAGVGASSTTPATYVAESRVAVGSTSLDARVVAGYSQATQQLAADLARYVNEQQAEALLGQVIGAGADTVQVVAASPIPESSIIRVEVTGTDRDVAQRGATTVARDLTDRVNALSTQQPTELLDEYTRLSRDVATFDTQVRVAQQQLDDLAADEDTSDDELAEAQQRLTDAQSALSVAKVQQTATGQRYQAAETSVRSAEGLRMISDGVVTTDQRTSQMTRFGVAGLGGGLVLALIAASARERRRPRRRPAGVHLPAEPERSRLAEHASRR